MEFTAEQTDYELHVHLMARIDILQGPICRGWRLLAEFDCSLNSRGVYPANASGKDSLTTEADRNYTIFSPILYVPNTVLAEV